MKILFYRLKTRDSPALKFFFEVLAFKLKASQCAQGQCDAAYVTGLWDVCEAWRGQLVSQAFGHAGVTQWLVHQHQGKHLQQTVLDVLLQLGDLTAQIIQHRCQCRTRWTGRKGQTTQYHRRCPLQMRTKKYVVVCLSTNIT